MRDFIGGEPTEQAPGNSHEYEKAKQDRETDCFYDMKFVHYKRSNVQEEMPQKRSKRHNKREKYYANW